MQVEDLASQHGAGPGDIPRPRRGRRATSGRFGSTGRSGPGGVGSPARLRRPAPGRSGRAGESAPSTACSASGGEPRRRRREGRTRSTGPGEPRNLHGPGTRAPGPTRRSARPGRAEPSRAKLWPRTASDGGGGPGSGVDHHPELGAPSPRPRTAHPHRQPVEDRPADLRHGVLRSPAGRRPSRRAARSGIRRWPR